MSIEGTQPDVPSRGSELTLQERETALKAKRVLNNSIVLSNIIELTTSVITKLANSDVSESISNQSLTRDLVNNLAANRIKEKILG